MFIRNGKATGSILMRDLPKPKRAAPVKAAKKVAAPAKHAAKPPEESRQAAKSEQEPSEKVLPAETGSAPEKSL